MNEEVKAQEEKGPGPVRRGFGLPKKLILFALLAGLLLMAYAWFSPYLAMWGIQRAIESNNPAALERYVDFPRVRESLKSDLNRRLLEEVAKDQTGFGALGLLLIAPMVEHMVNAFITPEGLASIGTGEDPQQGDLGAVRSWSLLRRGFSEILVHPKDNPEEGLVMERRGLGWKVVRLKLNTTPR
jgi:hypothetical protein